MKKIIFLSLLAIGMTGCSVESMDSTENLLTADAKYKVQEAVNPLGFYAGPNLKGTLSVWNDCDNLYIEVMPSGDDPEDVELGLFTSLPAINNGGNLIDDLEYDLTDATSLKWTISLSTLDTEAELLIFAKAWGDWAGVIGYGKQEYSTYDFDLTGCTCGSFSYEANDDGNYTFTYIAEEDMEGAKLSMTFPQANVTAPAGWINNDKGNSSAWKNEINLTACTSYSWTFNLTPDCLGIGQENANLWTDFTVGEDSKKGDLDNIVKRCN